MDYHDAVFLQQMQDVENELLALCGGRTDEVRAGQTVPPSGLTNGNNGVILHFPLGGRHG